MICAKSLFFFGTNFPKQLKVKSRCVNEKAVSLQCPMMGRLRWQIKAAFGKADTGSFSQVQS